MRLEATGNTFIYRWPGGAVRLEPGKPIDLPDDRAKRLLDKAPARVRVIAPTIQPGDRITWVRAGSVQTGRVEFLQDYGAGVVWAFVTIGECWAAVNMKFVTRSGDA
jgi:hypothetical protein